MLAGSNLVLQQGGRIGGGETRATATNAAEALIRASPEGMRPFRRVRGLAQTVMQLAALLAVRLALLFDWRSPVRLTKRRLL